MADDPVIKAFTMARKRMRNIKEDGLRVSRRVRPKADAKIEFAFGKYVGPSILQFIHGHEWVETRYSYTYDGTAITLTTWNLKATTIHDHKNRIILNAYVSALNSLIGHNKAAVNIVLIGCPLEKIIPSSRGGVIGTEHVNSAFAVMPSPSNTDGYIVIYRKEELKKVMLHELIHLYQIDFHTYDSAFDAHFSRMFRVHVKAPHKNPANPLCLYEAYTETLASYGVVVYDSIFLKDDIEWISRGVERLKHYFVKQAELISQHFCDKPFVEDTHVFAYYILKSELFQNLDHFLEGIKRNGVSIRNPRWFLDLCCKVMANPTIKTKQKFKPWARGASLRMTSF
jgi:hypothetical protein